MGGFLRRHSRQLTGEYGDDANTSENCAVLKNCRNYIYNDNRQGRK